MCCLPQEFPHRTKQRTRNSPSPQAVSVNEEQKFILTQRDFFTIAKKCQPKTKNSPELHRKPTPSKYHNFTNFSITLNHEYKGDTQNSKYLHTYIYIYIWYSTRKSTKNPSSTMLNFKFGNILTSLYSVIYSSLIS